VNYELIVIGASWGGLRAVGEILAALQGVSDAVLFVVKI
jgi:chemotaxis response regulator CheB